MASKPKSPLTPAQRRKLYKVAYPINRSPYGGMSINQKDYAAGQFLPGRRVYGQEPAASVHGDIQTQPLPQPLDHNHLRSLDLHQVEPTWKKHGKETRNAYGGVIFNDQGQVLLVEPSNHFLGYVWTFPKGGIDPGEHPADVGVREVKEESGHDASILGLVPKRFPGPSNPTNPSSHSHYFIMKSHGQTGKPDWETQDVRWASPEQAHKMIDMTYNENGKARDHEILDMAVKHLNDIRTNPNINSHLHPGIRRQIYENTKPCNGGCECDHCIAEQALTRIYYDRSERHAIIQQILYESRNKSHK